MKKIRVFTLITFVTGSMVACSSDSSLGSSDELFLESDVIVMESEDSAVLKPTESESARNVPVSTQYAVGDIILADGSTVKEEDLTVVDDNNLPIAVIAGFNDEGMALGIGVHRSDSPLQWAADDSAGYVTSFVDTVCIQDSAFIFSGDSDGSDNWDVICIQDESSVADTAENYPAYDFVNTYAEVYNLTGDYASGWYMPSIPELCEVYQNRVTINNSLQKIYELDSKAAMNGLETNWYWSSSQAESEDDYVWFVHFFNGYAGECPKNFTNVHVLAVRAF